MVSFARLLRFLLFGVIIFLIPLVFDVDTTDVHFLIKDSIFRILVVCITALTLFLFFKKSSVIVFEPFLGLMILFMGIGLLSYHSVFNNYFFLKKMLQFLSFFLLVSNLVMARFSRDQIRFFINLILFTGIIVAAIGIPEFWKIYIIDFSKYGFSMPLRCASTLGNPNFAMEYIHVIFPFSLALFFYASKKLQNILYGGIFLLFSVYIILARGRAGWVAFAVVWFLGQGILWYFTKKGCTISRKKLNFALLIVPVALCIMLLFPQIRAMAVENFDSIFDTKFSSNEFRILAWKATLNMFRDNPLLGIGWGQFEPVYPKYRDVQEMIISGADHRVGKAHNDFIQELAESGLTGFLSFAAMLVFILYRAFTVMKKKPDTEAFYIAFAVFLSVIGTSITAFFGSSFQMPVSSIYFWMVMGIFLCVYHQEFPVRIQNEFSVLFRRFSLILAVLFLVFPVLLSRTIVGNFYLRKALSSLAAYDNNQALGHLLTSYSFDHLNPETIFYIGMASTNLGKYDDAIKFYEYFFAGQPYFAECANNIGVAYDNMKNFDKAEEYYRKAIEIKPNFSDAYNNLGAVLTSKGKNDEAIVNYEKAVKYNPYHYRALNNIGIMYLEKNEGKKAREYFEKAVNVEPNFEKAWFNLANYYSTIGDWEHVQTSFQHLKTPALRQEYTMNLYRNGLGYYQRGEFSNAFRFLKLSVYLSPSAEQYFYLACAALLDGKTEETVKALDNAVTLDSGYIPAYVFKSAVLPDAAGSAAYRFAREVNFTEKQRVQFADTMYKNGTLMQTRKKLDAAIALLDFAIRLKVTQDCYNNLIVAHIEKKNFDHALRLCNEAIAMYGRYVKFYINRAIVYERKNMFEKAVQEYSAVIQNFSGKEAVIAKNYLQSLYERMGVYWLSQGAKEQAESMWQKGIQVNPSSSIAKSMQQKIIELNRSK